MIDVKKLFDLYKLEKNNLSKKDNDLISLKKEFDNLDIKKKIYIDKIINLYFTIISIYKFYEIKLFLDKKKIKYETYTENVDPKNYLINKKYEFIKDIGSGFFGDVYLFKKKDIFYACKIEEYLFDENKNKYFIENIDEFITRKNNEYKLLNIVGINNIGPKIYNNHYIIINNKLYNILIMEYIDGKTLYDYLRIETYTENKINKIKKLINKKINKLHKLNIIHGDLHLNNIMIVEKNNKINIFIIDLGLSRKTNNKISELKKNNYNILKNVNILNKTHIKEDELIIYKLYKNKKIKFIF